MDNIGVEELKNKMTDYIAVIDTFSQLLTEENRALAEFDTNVVGKLIERKSHIVGVYRGLVAYFIKNSESLKQFSVEERENLKEKSKHLDELLQENDKLLKTRMETSQSVMDSIINIAKVTNNANATSYGAQGKYSPQDNTKNAIAINRTL